MSSYQDKIELATYRAKRKLFDNTIRVTGTEFSIVRVKTETNKYGDDEVTIISEDSLTIRVEFPGEIPLNRFRVNTAGEQIDEQGIYLFDILPIKCWSKWEDNLEKGDFLLFKIKEERDENIVLLLQVSETLGQFSKVMSWKMNYIAPYNGQLIPELLTIINRLKES